MIVPARVHLAQLPTPVQPLTRLGTQLGLDKLYIKRDDQTGLAFGGNKTRKLETLCAAALAEGADMLVTAGAIQSNHCRQTAAAAAALGLSCALVLVGDRPAQSTANLLIDRVLGADIHWTAKAERDSTLQRVAEEARAAGHRPYLIPYGGSNAVGALAYAFALDELLSQLTPDWIVFATSSGGTQAGLVAGAHALGYHGRVLGISVDEGSAPLQARVASIATESSTLLGNNAKFRDADIFVNDSYLGAGYAQMGDPEVEAIRMFAQIEGLLVDPVYTGRAAAGLVDLARNGTFAKNDTVLFWHTGGTPALFAERYQAELGA